jgi:hypothetical protein
MRCSAFCRHARPMRSITAEHSPCSMHLASQPAWVLVKAPLHAQSSTCQNTKQELSVRVLRVGVGHVGQRRMADECVSDARAAAVSGRHLLPTLRCLRTARRGAHLSCRAGIITPVTILIPLLKGSWARQAARMLLSYAAFAWDGLS